MGLDIKDMARCRKRKIDARDVKTLERNICEVLEYLDKLKKEHPELDNNELFAKYEHEFSMSFEEYKKISFELIDTIMQKKTIEYFKSNNNEFIRQYSRIKNKNIKELEADEDPFKLIYNKKAFQKKVVKGLIITFRKLLEEGVEEVVRVKNICMPSGYEEYKVKTRIDKTKVKSEEEMLLLIINNSLELVEKMQKQGSVKLLECATKFFEKYNLFDTMMKSHSSVLRYLNIGEMSYELDGTPQNKGIRDIFEVKNLEKFSTDEIIGFNMFWQNKFAKEFKCICLANFAINQMDLLNNRDTELSEEALKNVLTKYDLINFILMDAFDEKTYSFKEPHINRDVQSDYGEYFRDAFPYINNDFREECEKGKSNYQNLSYIYAVKFNLISNQVSNLLKNKKIKNWGYIKEFNRELMDDNYILIGMDLDGYNMPIRVHAPKDKLIESLVEMESEAIIPMYEGAEDFIVRGEIIPANLALPLQKKHKEYLRKAEPTQKNKNILEHIIFLSNSDKFPEHLKKDVDGKKTRVRKYINIVTGKIYTKVGNQYVEFRKR